MKKLVAVVSLLLAVVLVFAACSKGENPPKKESDVAVVTPQNEGNGGTTEAPAPAEAQPQPNPQNGGQNSSEDNFIGEERAKQIALEKAGLSADAVVFERVELDFDDGVWEYEVEFRQGRTEYSADIKAEDGTVLSWEKDIDD